MLKVSKNRKQIFQPKLLPKNKQMIFFILISSYITNKAADKVAKKLVKILRDMTTHLMILLNKSLLGKKSFYSYSLYDNVLVFKFFVC